MWFYVQMWLPVWTVALTAAICFSVASFIMGAERKASSAIISAPVQGVMTGISRGPSEDRSSGLVSTQAGAFILAASVGGLYRGGGREPKLLVPDPAGRL